MTALPIDPSDEQITEWARALTGGNGSADYIRAAHQAGVEAERARAAAEATEEWGYERAGFDLSDPYLAEDRERAEADIKARSQRTNLPFVLVRRAVGPWEVQS
jgi:hypothetical protein